MLAEFARLLGWFNGCGYSLYLFVQIHFFNKHNLLLAALSEMNLQSALGLHPPCLPASWRKVFPFLARQLQSSEREAAMLHSTLRLGLVNQELQNKNNVEVSYKKITTLISSMILNASTLFKRKENSKLHNLEQLFYIIHLNIESCFCTGFYKHDSKLFSLAIALLYRHLPVKSPKWHYQAKDKPYNCINNIHNLIRSRGRAGINSNHGTLFILHLPFINQISFVTNKDNDNITSSFCTNLLNPPRSIQERLPICIAVVKTVI